jgi:hypothetical protein
MNSSAVLSDSIANYSTQEYQRGCACSVITARKPKLETVACLTFLFNVLVQYKFEQK